MISGDGGEDRGPREWELVGQTTAGGLERDVRYKLEETDLYRASTDLYLYALSGLHFTELLILSECARLVIQLPVVCSKISYSNTIVLIELEGQIDKWPSSRS